VSKFQKSINKLEKQINWIMIEPKTSAFNRGDLLTIGFGKKNERTGSRQTTVRICNDIMGEMGWTLDDKLGIYHAESDPYHWMICKASNGYKVRQEANNKSTHNFTFMWRKDGINFTRSKSVDFECQKDKIVFRVPLEQEEENEE